MDCAIAITGVGSISPLGCSWSEIERNYAKSDSQLEVVDIDDRATVVGRLRAEQETLLAKLSEDDPRLNSVDRTVRMAVLAAGVAVQDAGWKDPSTVGINVGSSRGATETFENHHQAYLSHPRHRVPPMASPSTTLGSISSWVGQSIGSRGITFSHSMTCSTAAHAILNGLAWLRSGMADRFLVGGSEAPLTGFTIAQMRALRLYAAASTGYPCQPLGQAGVNSVALGEGAALLALERLDTAPTATDSETDGRRSRRIHACITGVGYAAEAIGTGTSLSADGICLQRSMRMALESTAPSGSEFKSVDAIILHAPGTVRGDAAELAAIDQLFGGNRPMLLSNKWRLGHTFGASAALSVEYALHLLSNPSLTSDFPYPILTDNCRRQIRRIMVNSTGFGGNAVSLILEQPVPRYSEEIFGPRNLPECAAL